MISREISTEKRALCSELNCTILAIDSPVGVIAIDENESF